MGTPLPLASHKSAVGARAHTHGGSYLTASSPSVGARPDVVPPGSGYRKGAHTWDRISCLSVPVRVNACSGGGRQRTSCSF